MVEYSIIQLQAVLLCLVHFGVLTLWGHIFPVRSGVTLQPFKHWVDIFILLLSMLQIWCCPVVNIWVVVNHSCLAWCLACSITAQLVFSGLIIPGLKPVIMLTWLVQAWTPGESIGIAMVDAWTVLHIKKLYCWSCSIHRASWPSGHLKLRSYRKAAWSVRRTKPLP